MPGGSCRCSLARRQSPRARASRQGRQSFFLASSVTKMRRMCICCIRPVDDASRRRVVISVANSARVAGAEGVVRRGDRRRRRRRLVASPNRRASGVFTPLPDRIATTSSPSRMTPRARAASTAATVTPPAVSTKIPSFAARPADRGGRRGVRDRLDRAAGPASQLQRVARRRPGEPIASERTIVSGCADGPISSTPSANAVATGEQPSGWPPTNRTSFGSTRPIVDQLVEALGDLREHRARRDRPDEDVRQAPAELLGDLERDRLAALRVERPEVDVDERPALLVGDLEAEPVDVVVRAVDADDGRAVARGRARPWRARGPTGRRRRPAARAAAAAAAVAPARLPVEAQASVSKPNSTARAVGDRDDAILEAERRVAGVVLEMERRAGAQVESRAEAVGADEGRRADGEPALRGAARRAAARGSARSRARARRSPRGSAAGAATSWS